MGQSSDTPEGVRFAWERMLRGVKVTKPSVKHVALALATYADGKTGGRIHPGVARLRDDTGLSDRTIGDALKELRGLGLLVQTSTARSGGRGGGPGRASSYRLAMPEAQPEPVEDTSDPWNDPSDTADHSAIDPFQTATQSENDRQSSTEWSAVSAEWSATSWGPSNSDHQGENIIHPGGHLSDAHAHARAADDERPPGFQDFWQAYPKGGGKLGAMTEWEKAVEAGADPKDILTGAQRYATECQSRATEPRYIKSPANWLRDERWTDEYPAQQHKPSDAYIWNKPRLGPDERAKQTLLLGQRMQAE